jgi:ELWxxDGT repeat protein
MQWSSRPEIMGTVGAMRRLCLLISGFVLAASVLAAGTGARAATEPGPSSNLTRVGHIVFFAASDGVHGSELWKSDGTTSGTVMVKDINPGPDWSTPSHLTAVQGVVYFRADDGTHGNQLWKSDGTRAGTVRLTRVVQPSGGCCGNLTAAGSTLFFSATDGTHGVELWKSRGTLASTHMVVDLNPGSPRGFVEAGCGCIVAMGSDVDFAGNDGVHGYQVWRSDGTVAGTVRVTNIGPNRGGIVPWPHSLTDVQGTLYFVASDGCCRGPYVWVTHGSAASTHKLGGGIGPVSLTPFGTRLLFVSWETTHGEELWVSNGTAAGTHLLKDINPGTGDGVSTTWAPVTLGDIALFEGYTKSTGGRLHRTDGTAAGTRIVRIKGGPKLSCCNSALSRVKGIGVLFMAGTLDDVLWRSDGTYRGTVRVKDLFGGSDNRFDETDIVRLRFGTALVLGGGKLWITRGTETTTHLVKRF